MSETYNRTLAKTVSWRAIGISTTCIILYVVTGNISLSIAVGAIDAIIKSVLYFSHERAWEKVEWGNDN